MDHAQPNSALCRASVLRLLASCVTLAGVFTPMSAQTPTSEQSAKIETLINPAGTHTVVLSAMPIRGEACQPNAVALTAKLITRHYSHLWARNSPEAVHLGFLSPNRELFAGGINIETPHNRREFPVSTVPGRQLHPCTEWEHRIILTRNQFLWIASAPMVTASGANSDAVSLSDEHMKALRDLASRMEPEESVVNPPDPDVFSFEGELLPGLVYQTKLKFRDDGVGWWPTEPSLRIPLHHALRLEWVNVSEFPQLSVAKNPMPHEVIFLVVDRKVIAMGPNRWNTTIQCKALKVK